MYESLPAERLLAVIELQNEIAAASLDFDSVLAVVADLALTLTTADAVVVEVTGGYYTARGSADGAVSMTRVPVAYGGGGLGDVTVYSAQPDAFDQRDVATLELLAGVISAHWAGAVDESLHDPVTGLRCRRAFDERLESELSRARRHGSQFALCLLRLQPVGGSLADAVVKAVAAKLSQVRGEDAAYRLAPDDFALVLVEASSYGAEAAIERFTVAMSSDASCHAVAAAWGVASFQRGDDATAMLARAGAALHRANSVA